MVNTQAVLRLAEYLKAESYQFVTTTPASHERVMLRNTANAQVSARDIFGWNKPFKASSVDAQLLSLIQAADICIEDSGLFKSKVRFSSLDNHLFMHSAYPTLDPDAIFFGPDSYRFARLLKKTIACFPTRHYNRIADIGTGSGVGGVVATSCLQHSYQELILADVNPKALAYAKINATLAATDHVSFCQSDLYSKIKAPLDLIIANPPYLADAEARVYRHGGGEFGSLLSTRIVLEGLPLLSDGGTMILYTGSTIVDGVDTFFASIQGALMDAQFSYNYEEIDPDAFGEELVKEAYSHADRIAIVSLVVVKSVVVKSKSS
jgi:methylase of polypeptide subunit release factors